MNLTMDSSELTRFGTYQARLTVGSDTPYPAIPVDVALTVEKRRR